MGANSRRRDSGNLYGDEDTRRILCDWWSGEGPSAGIWRFNLKAEADDPVGHSFAVFVPNDAGRQDRLERFVTDARAGRATRVFVTGRLFTFPAPTQARGLTGLYLEMASSQDIRFDPWEGDEKPEASHLPPPEGSHPGSADDASPASPDPNRR